MYTVHCKMYTWHLSMLARPCCVWCFCSNMCVRECVRVSEFLRVCVCVCVWVGGCGEWVWLSKWLFMCVQMRWSRFFCLSSLLLPPSFPLLKIVCVWYVSSPHKFQRLGDTHAHAYTRIQRHPPHTHTRAQIHTHTHTQTNKDTSGKVGWLNKLVDLARDWLFWTLYLGAQLKLSPQQPASRSSFRTEELGTFGIFESFQ